MSLREGKLVATFQVAGKEQRQNVNPGTENEPKSI